MKTIIAIPAHNEEEILEKNILKLYKFCQKNLTGQWLIVIVNNNSTDSTEKIGRRLADEHSHIIYLYTPLKGKGWAIRTAWSEYENYETFCFMDADLSSGLETLPELISYIEKEEADITIGSRYLKKSKVCRSLIRKIISRCYRWLLKLFFKTRLKDLPCGFKAVNQKVVANLMPQIKNNHWFFDSELVLLAEHQNYRIKEIPIIWREHCQRKTKVKLWPVIMSYLKEMKKLKKRLKNEKY